MPFRIALPNKGSLAERAADLLREGGYNTQRTGRQLTCHDTVNDVEFLFLRPSDIAVFVAKGQLDVGVTGLDLMYEADAAADVLLELEFARSTFCFAAPVEGTIAATQDLQGRRIATSFPKLVGDFLDEHRVTADVIRLEGAVEIAIKLGVADAIADVVETGSTLTAAGLRTFGEPIMESQAVLIRRFGADASAQADQLVNRIEGVLLAKRFVLLEFNILGEHLDEACKIAPGLNSPTVSRLQSEEWRAVRTMVQKSDVHQVMDRLSVIGATGLLVTQIQACRL